MRDIGYVDCQQPRIHPCGSGWAYCDGDCTDCPKAKTITTNSTTYEEVYGIETTTDGIFENKPK